jgi:HEAT repeat protein
MGDRNSVASLVHALQNDDILVQDAAKTALLQIGEPVGQSAVKEWTQQIESKKDAVRTARQSSVPALIDQLISDESSEARDDALRKLGQTADVRAVSAALRVLRDNLATGKPQYSTNRAAEALERLMKDVGVNVAPTELSEISRLPQTFPYSEWDDYENTERLRKYDCTTLKRAATDLLAQRR